MLEKPKEWFLVTPEPLGERHRGCVFRNCGTCRDMGIPDSWVGAGLFLHLTALTPFPKMAGDHHFWVLLSWRSRLARILILRSLQHQRNWNREESLDRAHQCFFQSIVAILEFLELLSHESFLDHPYTWGKPCPNAFWWAHADGLTPHFGRGARSMSDGYLVTTKFITRFFCSFLSY